ncbi:MAG: hypothetical protein ACK4E8_12535 [Lacibacter sp.]
MLLITLWLLYSGCNKADRLLQPPPPPQVAAGPAADIQRILQSNFFVQNRKIADLPTHRTAPAAVETHAAGPSEYPDEAPMVLGGPLPIPYSIPVMTEAYNVYYATQLTTVPVTDLYVRFSPQNEAQLALLEDSLDLDLYDYPLDHEVISDGDYYPQPGKAAEDMPDFYTTVPVNFAFPAGVPYTILEELHFPHNDVILEALAESIAAGGHYSGVPLNTAQQGQQQTYGSDARPVLMTNLDNNAQLINSNNCGCDPNPFDLQCIPPDPTCGGGGDPGWGGGGNPGPPSFPPGFVTPPQNRPSGHINVFDTQLGNIPLHNVRVIAKRGFIRTMGYTNAAGHFITARAVAGSSKLILRYRNPDVSVRPLRTHLRLRLSLLVVRQVMGRYNLPLNNIQFTVTRNNNRTSKSFENWLAAHAINSYSHFAQQAHINDVKRMTGHRLCIYLQKHSDEDNRGPEADLTLQNYIFKNRGPGDWMFETAKLAVYAVNQNWLGVGMLVIENILSTQKPDILYKYNTLFENLSSNEVNQQFFAAYAKAGTFKAINDNDGNLLNTRWKFYFKIKDKWIDAAVGLYGSALKHAFKDIKALKFLVERDIWYVNGTNNQLTWTSVVNISATLLANVYFGIQMPERDFYNMVEGFGEYYGHYLADKRYGMGADPILDQQRKRVFSSGGVSSHKNYLENWNPNEGMDLRIGHKVGLFHDLEDETNTEYIPGTNIIDWVKQIKPSASQKSISGYMPRLVPSPQEWRHLKWNLQTREPSQNIYLDSLFNAYNAN